MSQNQRKAEEDVLAEAQDVVLLKALLAAVVGFWWWRKPEVEGVVAD